MMTFGRPVLPPDVMTRTWRETLSGSGSSLDARAASSFSARARTRSACVSGSSGARVALCSQTP